jgi:hypothetical protein
VTVDVPSTGLVAIFGQAEIKGNSSGFPRTGISLFEPTELSAPEVILKGETLVDFTPKWTSPDGNGFGGAASRTSAGWIVLSLAPGTRTFSYRYSALPAETATFRNRKLWVMTVG